MLTAAASQKKEQEVDFLKPPFKLTGGVVMKVFSGVFLKNSTGEFNWSCNFARRLVRRTAEHTRKQRDEGGGGD